ncbi:MAG: SPOR domain-containing protein [Candidatus Omnitrophota bacterium]
MLEDYNGYQLELFNETGGGASKRPLGNRFFNFLHRHEKKFLVIIGIAVSCMISFSLGVRKGRQLSVFKSSVSFDLAEKRIKVEVVEVKEKPELIRQQKQPAVKNNSSQDYTIQLASYKAKKFADREAEVLKKKGLMPLVLYKGDYVVLCAGKFSDREEAVNSMTKLKKQYKDCILRRL